MPCLHRQPLPRAQRLALRFLFIVQTRSNVRTSTSLFAAFFSLSHSAAYVRARVRESLHRHGCFYKINKYFKACVCARARVETDAKAINVLV